MNQAFVMWLFLFASAVLQAQIAVRGKIVHTMNGEDIADGVVLVDEGRIKAVGPAAVVEIPGGWTVLEANVVTPGLVDAHSVVGLAGYFNADHDQEQIERSSSFQPELRAMDAYNPHEALVTWLREHGVTTIHTGHAPAALVPGQGMIIKTMGRSVEEDVLVPQSSVLAVLGDSARAESGKSPGTKSKMVAQLRAELVAAGEYLRKKAAASTDEPIARDLPKEALGRVLKKEVPMMVTVNRDRDILTVLRLAREFDIRIILDGASEVYQVMDQVAEAGVSVVLHPTMARARGERENLSFTTAARLKKRGVLFAIQSGYESYVPKTRVVLFEAALAAAHGLSRRDALAAITLDAARILGVQDRVGSLEVGKDADLVLFDGDPFEYTTHVTGVVMDGRVVSRKVR